MVYKVVSSEMHSVLMGDVDGYLFQKLLADISYAKAHGIKTMHLHIMSPGGYVMPLMGILDLLDTAKREGLHIVTYIDGLAASAAAAIFMCGDERIMDKTGFFMIHPMGGMPEQSQVNASTWYMFQRWIIRYAALIEATSDFTFDEAKKLLTGSTNRDTHFFSAIDCLNHGFATSLR